ncbi:MAG: enoyl-CoA hydratase-related protein [Halioglobus sp.]
MFDHFTTISVTREGAVDYLCLDRPELLNAINTQMVTELREYFGSLPHTIDTRVVVLAGNGRAFCAGLDIGAISGSLGDQSQQPDGGGWGFQGYLAEVYVMMRRIPQPIISLVHGAACGGGFSLALASDIRIAGESAKMNAAFIKVGLSACDMGTSYFLPRLVGTSIASELMLTGRFINAQRALATGLVSEVVPDDELLQAVKPYVDDMLRTSPMGLRLTKEGLNVAIDSNSLEAVIAMENRNQVLCAQSPDAKEGMAAFMEKREPQYGGK